MSGIKLIVGLANPGKDYKDTRHNAGEWLVEELINQEGITLKPEVKFHGLHGQGILYGSPCHFLIPTTYMNLSGQAVRAVSTYYKIAPEEILVAHDEVDLPVGTVKLKFDGGNGGHNGLKDIISHLNTRQFYRLRIGVGRPPAGRDTADYVLGKPSRADRDRIDAAIHASMSAIPYMLDGENQKAMHLLHTQDEGKA